MIGGLLGFWELFGVCVRWFVFCAFVISYAVFFFDVLVCVCVFCSSSCMSGNGCWAVFMSWGFFHGLWVVVWAAVMFLVFFFGCVCGWWYSFWSLFAI